FGGVARLRASWLGFGAIDLFAHNTGPAMMHVLPQFQPILRELGIDADAVFDHPLIKSWRTLADRENCTLDATLSDRRTVRRHVKRYPAAAAAKREVEGFRLLAEADIPTAPLVAWGVLGDGRSF